MVLFRRESLCAVLAHEATAVAGFSSFRREHELSRSHRPIAIPSDNLLAGTHRLETGAEAVVCELSDLAGNRAARRRGISAAKSDSGSAIMIVKWLTSVAHCVT